MKEIYLSEHLETQSKEQSSQSKYNFLWGILLLVAGGILATVNAFFLILGVAGAIPLFIRGTRQANQSYIYDQGVNGEEILRRKLRSTLSEDYTAFYNVPLNPGDIDCVVVGPSGVYAFEVKNHRGEIVYNEGGWSQIKVGRGGTAYKGHLSNPSGQLGKYIRQLREELEKKGVGVWVNGFVVFTNPEARVIIEAEMKKIKAVTVDEVSTLFERQNPTLHGDKRVVVESALMALKKC